VKLQRVALVAALALTIVPVTASADDRDDMLALAQRIAGRYGQATVTLHAVPPVFGVRSPSACIAARQRRREGCDRERRSTGRQPRYPHCRWRPARARRVFGNAVLHGNGSDRNPELV
jgi:hypothetical protein